MRYAYPMEIAGRRDPSALAGFVSERMTRLGLPDVLFVAGGFYADTAAEAASLLRKERKEADVLRLGSGNAGTLGRIPRRRYALLVDCLLHETEDLSALRAFLNGNGGYTISCDLPCGLGRGGIAAEDAVRADETLVLGPLPCELLLADGADYAGKIREAGPFRGEGEGILVYEDGDVSKFFPPKKSHSNKGGYGSAAVLAGYGMLGAPLLSVGAALKSGAGYTEFWLPNSAALGMDAAQTAAASAADRIICAMVTAKYPACIVGIYDGEPFFSDALAYGMGAGVSPAVRDTLGALLSGYGGTLVLDADALNTLAACGKDMLRTKKCPVIVTPHIKEFSRLTGKTVGESLSDPIGCAKAFSVEYGVTVVLKNNRTVITDGVRTAVNTTGTPALAKGGSGDVLAGLLAGLSARLAPFEAAVAGCYLLGRAGEIAAERMGEYAPDASDLIRLLPEAELSLLR